MNVSVGTDRPILSPCGLENFDHQVDTYIGCGHCCYYCYALAQAETDWTKEIQIHHDIAGRLNEELHQIPPQTIYMGYHTDPYQPCEAEHYQTRKVLELFREKGFSASILTKSALVARDIPILKEMPSAAVSVSVAFNDNPTRKLFEANTMDTEERLEALRQAKEAGIRTGALVCPVVPYVTDAISLIELLEPLTDTIWIYGISFADRLEQNWLNTQDILKRNFPDASEQITSAIFSREHIYWRELRDKLLSLKKDRGLNLNIHV